VPLPQVIWHWQLRRRKWNLAKPDSGMTDSGMTGRIALLLVLLYAASFAVFITLFYAGMYLAALTDGI